MAPILAPKLIATIVFHIAMSMPSPAHSAYSMTLPAVVSGAHLRLNPTLQSGWDDGVPQSILETLFLFIMILRDLFKLIYYRNIARSIRHRAADFSN